MPNKPRINCPSMYVHLSSIFHIVIFQLINVRFICPTLNNPSIFLLHIKNIDMALSVCIYIQLELLVRNPCFDALSLIHSLNTPPSMIIHPPVVFSQSIPFSPPQSVLPPSSFPLSPLIIMSRHVFDIRLLLSLFLPFFHLSCCISINLLLSSKAL